MKITHIEVIDAKNHAELKNGQMLKITFETPCFFWIVGFDGIEYKVSKKTKKINGTKKYFISSTKQPTVNI